MTELDTRFRGEVESAIKAVNNALNSLCEKPMNKEKLRLANNLNEVHQLLTTTVRETMEIEAVAQGAH